MSLVEMHSALARLYVDETFLERFCATPDQALARYDLTVRETAALVGIDRGALRKYASSLRLKTRGRFEHAYDLLLKLDAGAFHKHYMRFYELRTIRPYESFDGPIVEFGRFLEGSFAGNPEVPLYAAGLVRYQRLFFQARFEARARPGPQVVAAAEETLSDRCRLATSPSIRLERFSHDVTALEEALREGESPRDVQPEACCVVFQSQPEMGRARKFRVSEPTAKLLAFCDGTRELGEIATSLEAERDVVRKAAAKLLGLGVLVEAPRE